MHPSRQISAAGEELAAAVLDAEITAGRTPGVQYVFADAEQILFHHEAGVSSVAGRTRVTGTTTFNGFSTTKTFTAVAILQLAERGLVSLDAPAAQYRAGFPYRADITVRHLLTHTARIPNPIPLRWTHLQDEHAAFNRSDFFAAQFRRNSQVKGGPGERFGYSNLGYQLLGEIIEAVSGSRYEANIRENILAPIGVRPEELEFEINEQTHARGYHSRKSWDYYILGLILDRKRALERREGEWQLFRRYYMNGAAYGGLVGTATGFTRFAQALLRNPSPLLSAESKRALFAPYVLKGGAKSGMSLSWFQGNVDGTWFVDHAGGGGGYYAELRIYPEEGCCSVLMMNRTGMSNRRILSRVDQPLMSLR